MKKLFSSLFTNSHFRDFHPFVRAVSSRDVHDTLNLVIYCTENYK